MSETSKKEIITSIRNNLEWFGLDLSEVTDDQIEESVLKFSEMIGSTGITAKQASGILFKLSKIG